MIMVAEKCHRKLGWGKHAPNEYSDENSTRHDTVDGKWTVCGIRIGNMDNGWFVLKARDAVTCKRCKRILKNQKDGAK